MRQVGLVTFRVYPEDRTLYFVVNVWPTKKALNEHRKKSLLSGECEAYCSGFEVIRFRGGKWRKMPKMGEVNLHRLYIPVGVVIHEMTHAALEWAERVGIADKMLTRIGPNVSKSEEKFCYALQRMTNQAIEIMRRRGLT